MLQCAHSLKTPPGFPTAKRPAVVRLFHKNGHNYRKDYHLAVRTLGRQVMEWWSELCPPGGVLSIQFGGPTGIYTIVVLLSWWCSMLKPHPENERADCLRTLIDVNRALLAAVNHLKHQVASTPAFSPTTPPPPSQPRKRANTTDLSPGNRKRSART